MSDQRFEDRARAAKAARIARVLEHLLDDNPHLSLAQLEGAGQDFRDRVGVLAGCKRPPSERTWAVTMGLLSESRQRAAS